MGLICSKDEVSRFNFNKDRKWVLNNFIYVHKILLTMLNNEVTKTFGQSNTNKNIV